MAQNLGLILLVFAFVIAFISIFVGAVGRASMLSVAITFWIASELAGGLGKVFH